MKSLVAFFSAGGITKEVAQKIAEMTESPIYEIVPQEPYSKADLDWTNEQSRTSIEMRDKASRPKIASDSANRIEFSEFEIIFVGFPIWWYTAPHIINTFLESYDFSGKTIIPFCTSGGSELGNAPKDMQKSAPNATFKSGARFNFGQSKGSIRKWLDTLGFEA